MKQKRIIGLFLCGLLIGLGFILQGDLGLYLNLAALCIVIGGTLFATLVSYKLERLVIILKRSHVDSCRRSAQAEEGFFNGQERKSERK